MHPRAAAHAAAFSRPSSVAAGTSLPRSLEASSARVAAAAAAVAAVAAAEGVAVEASPTARRRKLALRMASASTSPPSGACRMAYLPSCGPAKWSLPTVTATPFRSGRPTSPSSTACSPARSASRFELFIAYCSPSTSTPYRPAFLPPVTRRPISTTRPLSAGLLTKPTSTAISPCRLPPAPGEQGRLVEREPPPPPPRLAPGSCLPG
mmetsp:Transcript_42029/g.137102  ORF Transcript_42029/g.137102 Transcript_42029/m.137102 type:complete len:208 (+) Transcript_42029:207-830(+)